MQKKIVYALLLFLVIQLRVSGQIQGSQTNVKFDIAKAPAPLFRDPVYDGAADPTVIWHSATKKWIIFYTARRAALDLKGVAYCYGTSIGIAASADYGKTWTYEGTANLPQPDTGLNSFWAPQVFQNPDDQLYHMIVTYIKGVYDYWGGEAQVFHYTSKDLKTWKKLNDIGLRGCIDASVFRLPDHSWKIWYKDQQGVTSSGTSKDLSHWTFNNTAEVKNRGHEGPVVFYFNNAYWMITDPTYDDYTGLDVFRSVDATHWEYNNTILNTPGIRPDDIDQGRHADVKIVNNKAYIFYFTHPGRVYPGEKEEDNDNNRWRYRRSSLQVAELELESGKMICDRNKYALLKNIPAKKIPQ
ncbi:hypothetical protein DVR12_14490 [Chitinophaga silvatica]|uniref:Glycosyl hydrolases family 43 n=1 Tax=Chitinophaga silvatica TaxID=2282649 RepID=A0A3E1Y8T8_9BACT|nr:hypothetical protein [Chitinophaga silvatica]RFS21859.1 hypothetical protein DVR12_14490 [Chitinophaga silvatica]